MYHVEEYVSPGPAPLSLTQFIQTPDQNIYKLYLANAKP